MPLLNLGVIPARAGSKGVKNKNLRDLNGVPLIVHTIRAAAASALVDDFLVTTDSPEIQDIARSNGADAPFLRPPELASDTAPMIGTVRHAVDFYEAEHGRQIDTVVLLQPTNPLRTAQDIDGAIETFQSSPGARSLITYSVVGSQHPNYMYRRLDDALSPLMAQISSDRRQDYEEVLIRNGLVYVSSRAQIMDGAKVYTENPLGYEIPAERACNIDAEEDFLYAEFLLSRLANKPEKSPEIV